MIVKKNKKGFGVYANHTYKKGEEICVMLGKKVVPKTLEYHGGEFRKASSNPLQIGPALYLELAKPYIYINHSCDPNAGLKDTATLFAIKPIKNGAEITYDYSTTIDESFECRCGSKKCRGAMVDFFGLSRRVQKYYAKRGALPDFIMKKYAKSKKMNKLK